MNKLRVIRNVALAAIGSGTNRLNGAVLFVVAVIATVLGQLDARAQFTNATDNASNYGGTWNAGDNKGSGFNAWSFNNGASTGQFIGNPSNNGMGTGGIGTTAFGLYSTVNGNYYNASRTLSTGMSVGDTFSFYWAMNWDTGGGNKGIVFQNNGTDIFSINNGSSSTITVNGTNADTSYGTSPMLVTITRTSASAYSFSMQLRENTNSTYTATINSSSAIDGFKIYGTAFDNNGNRNIYFNNFTSTNSGVFTQGGTVTNANTFTGTGALSIGNNTTLALSGGGNNNYTGTTTISNGSTLRFQGSGTSDFASAIGSSGSIVVSNGSGQVNFKADNSLFTGAITITNGTMEAWHANAFGGTATGTIVGSGATLKLYTNASGITYAAEALTLNGVGVSTNGALRNEGGDNKWTGLITLSSDTRINSAAGSLTLDVASGNAITGTYNLTIGGAANTTINDNINISTGKLVKDGASTLTLGAVNNYTGNTEIDEGVLAIGSGGGLSSSSKIYIGNGTNANSATLSVAGTTTLGSAIQANISSGNGLRTISKADATSQTMSGDIALNRFTYFDVSNAAGNLTASGAISGSQNIVKTGTGTLSLSGNSTSYSGGIYVDAGVLNFSGGSLGSGTALALGAETGGSDAAALNFGAADLITSRNLEVRAGSGTRTVSYTPNSGTSTLAGNITLSNSVAFNVASGGTLVASGGISGSGGLTKAGIGRLNLTGASGYTGATQVSQGDLAVNGSIASAVTVANGATLSGSGTVGGSTATVIQSGGTHSPGNSPGLQTFSSGLTYNSGSIFKWELTANTTNAVARGVSFDGVNVTGGALTINTGVTSSLVFNGTGSVVSWSDALWSYNRSWLVFSNVSTPTLASAAIFDTITFTTDKDGAVLTAIHAGADFKWQQINQDVYLTYVIPEPSTYALLSMSAMGMAGYMIRRRRR